MGKKNRITPSEVTAAINSKGGTLLSEYQNSKSYLRVKCARNHEWDVKWNDIQQGKWCPYCTKFNSKEEQCRHILQSLTGEDFRKENKMLGKGLQLDGYCPKLNIAFEYDGMQHFQANRYWDRDESDFQSRQHRDAEKTLKCDELGIKLLRIPYTQSGDLENHIRRELEYLGIAIKAEEVDWSAFWAKNDTRLEECRTVIEDKGGRLLSLMYDGKQDLKWECCNGHVVYTRGRELLRGIGCAECAGKKKGSIAKMQRLAEPHGGKCVSTEYTNSYSRLLWECSEKHQWLATPSSIQKGSWCKQCYLNARYGSLWLR